MLYSIHWHHDGPTGGGEGKSFPGNLFWFIAALAGTVIVIVCAPICLIGKYKCGTTHRRTATTTLIHMSRVNQVYPMGLLSARLSVPSSPEQLTTDSTLCETPPPSYDDQTAEYITIPTNLEQNELPPSYSKLQV